MKLLKGLVFLFFISFYFVSLYLLFFSFLLISAAFTSDIIKLVILFFVQFLKLVLVSEIDGQTS